MNTLIKRTNYVKQLLVYKDHNLIKLVTGLRRSGKSTLFKLYQNELINSGINPNNIQSFNFENPLNYHNKNWFEIFQNIISKLDTTKKNYVFLDEIQNIDEFEKLIDGLYINDNIDLYITGSNAQMLSGEFATLLSGRHVEVSILPFSFAEYLDHRNIDYNIHTNYELLFTQYINETSLPKGLDFREDIFAMNQYIQNVYDTVIEKDILSRHKINNKRVFANIVKYIISNIGSEVSPSSISKALKTDGQEVHHKTVSDYLEYLCDCYFLYKVNRFDIRGKKQLATLEKYYLVDIGFKNTLIGELSNVNRGHNLENIVYFELLRRGNTIWVGKTNSYEVDFVCKNKQGQIRYYQVAWSVADDKALNREYRPFYQIKDNYPKTLLTTDYFTVNENGYEHKNVFEWLLKN